MPPGGYYPVSERPDRLTTDVRLRGTPLRTCVRRAGAPPCGFSSGKFKLFCSVCFAGGSLLTIEDDRQPEIARRIKKFEFSAQIHPISDFFPRGHKVKFLPFFITIFTATYFLIFRLTLFIYLTNNDFNNL